MPNFADSMETLAATGAEWASTVSVRVRPLSSSEVAT